MSESIKGGIANVLIVVLCLGMLGAGMIKIMSLPQVVEVFEQWGFPAWFRILVGVVEFIIGICIFLPYTRKYALGSLVILMLGALSTHIYFGEYYDTRGPILIMLGAIILLYFNKNKGNIQTSK